MAIPITEMKMNYTVYSRIFRFDFCHYEVIEQTIKPKRRMFSFGKREPQKVYCIYAYPKSVYADDDNTTRLILCVKKNWDDDYSDYHYFTTEKDVEMWNYKVIHFNTPEEAINVIEHARWIQQNQKDYKRSKVAIYSTIDGTF